MPPFSMGSLSDYRDEMKGANPATLQEKVAQWRAAVPQSFAGGGATLGGGGAPLDAAAAREARLKKLGGGGGGSPSPAAAATSFTLDLNAATAAAGSTSSTGASAMENDDDAGLQAALALSMNDAPSPTAGAAAAASPVAPPPAGSGEGAAAEATTQSPAMDEGSDQSAAAADTTELPPVDAKLLSEGTGMGFPELHVRKALMAGCSNLDAAVTWVLEHGSDANINDPIPPVAKTSSSSSSSGSSGSAEAEGGGQVHQSWKCVETGRLFRTMEEVQMYAEKTGRSNFAESTEAKKPLTEEEKAAKLLELKAKIAAKREAAGEVWCFAWKVILA